MAANTSVTFRVAARDATPDDDTGGDGIASSPQRLVAAGSPEHISPHAGTVSYDDLDATDYVRVGPGDRFTSVLLCAETSIEHSAIAVAIDAREGVGTYLSDGRCLAAAVAAWDGILFEVQAARPGEQIRYEVIALSGKERPDLGLVSWYVASRLMANAQYTRGELRQQVREFLSAFAIDFRNEPVASGIGDATSASFISTLAEIATDSP
jgi:hypothetical protein